MKMNHDVEGPSAFESIGFALIGLPMAVILLVTQISESVHDGVSGVVWGNLWLVIFIGAVACGAWISVNRKKARENKLLARNEGPLVLHAAWIPSARLALLNDQSGREDPGGFTLLIGSGRIGVWTGRVKNLSNLRTWTTDEIQAIRATVRKERTRTLSVLELTFNDGEIAFPLTGRRTPFNFAMGGKGVVRAARSVRETLGLGS